MKIINLATLFIFLLLVPSSIFQATAQMEGLNWEHPAFDRTNTGFSPQTQITKDNINDLELRWIFQVPGYWGSGGGVPGEVIAVEGDGHAGHDHSAHGEGGFNFEVPHVPTGVQTVPLVVNGIVYIASEFNVLYALNAENSQLLWRFAAPIGSFDEKNWWAKVYAQHAIDYFDDKVWMQASDCTIYGLDPMTGEVLVTIPDTCKDIPGNTGIYWASFAPIEYNNLLITRPTGGGGFTGERGFISAYDKDTGELVWRWETIPPTGNEEDWAADLVSKGNLDNYPWDWGKCEKVEHAGHGEEDEGHVDDHNAELLAIMTEIEANVHEFEEKAPRLPLNMGMVDEILNIVSEIEEHVGNVKHEIEHPHGGDLIEMMHVVEEHIHELEEKLNPISGTDELLAILANIESGIAEFEEHEAEEHGEHGKHGEEGEGHGGHGGHGDGAEINYLTAEELRLLAMVTGITVNIHDFEEKATELGIANDETTEIIHEIEERLDDITRDIQSNFFAKERLDELMHEVEEHIHELEESVSDEGLLAILADIEDDIEEFEAFELAGPEDARTKELLAIMTVVDEHVHELEEKLAELGLESDEITEILHVIEENVGDVKHQVEHPHGADLLGLMHEVEEHLHELEEIVSDEEVHVIIEELEQGVHEFEERFAVDDAGHGGHGGHGEEGDHNGSLLGIIAEIEHGIDEYQEVLSGLGLGGGHYHEIMEIIHVIEEHIHEMEGEIEAGHHDHLMEILHEIEEHVHELEESISNDELHAIIGEIEHAIHEFEEHEADEHAGHGEEGEEEHEGHEGHGHDEERKNGLHDCNWIGGGSVWTLIALDEDTGDIFFTTNAPTPDVPGDMRPGPNLFTASVVSLNANTGEMNWYYQIVTHDVYYHESRWSTILAEIESGDSTQKAVIVGSKTNLVHVLDADTGKPIYESIRVGPSAVNTINADMGNDADMELSQGDLVGQQVCPGFQGGIDAAPAFAHNTIYVVTQTFCTSYIEEEGAPYKDGVANIFHHVAGPIYFDSFHVGNSSLYAIDASNGRVKWIYEMENRNQYGAVTTSGGIVFVPDRMGMIHAVDEETGELLRIFTTGGLGGAGVSIGFNAYGQATLFITSGGAGEFGQRTTGILQAWTLPDGSVTETSSSETTPDLLSLVSLGIAVLAIGFSVYVTRKNRSN